MKFRFRRTDFGAALLAAFLCMVIQLLVTLCRAGGELHSESALFFMNYMDDRPFLCQVVNPLRNDWGLYQARELSYFFDWIDAHFVAFLLKRHIVWFHSVCSLVLCGLMVFCQQYFTRKFFPKIPGLVVTAISLLFAISPGAASLNYFRCAKYLTALGLWGAFFAGYAAFRHGGVRNRGLFCLSLFLMTLSDRQGFFYTAAICGTAGIVMLHLNRSHAPVAAGRMRPLILGAFAVTLFGVVNNLYLTPALVTYLNGYILNFRYQFEITVSPGNFAEGFLFLFGNIGNLFSSYSGNLRLASCTGLLLSAGILLELAFERCKGRRRWAGLALLWLCALGASCICGAVMAARHPAVVRPEVVYGTYALPMTVICFALVTLTAAGAGKKFRTLLLICLLAAIVLRIGTEMAGDKFGNGNDALSGYDSRQEVLKEALRNPAFDEKRYCMPRRMELFLEFCRERLLKNR